MNFLRKIQRLYYLPSNYSNYKQSIDSIINLLLLENEANSTNNDDEKKMNNDYKDYNNEYDVEDSDNDNDNVI